MKKNFNYQILYLFLIICSDLAGAVPKTPPQVKTRVEQVVSFPETNDLKVLVKWVSSWSKVNFIWQGELKKDLNFIAPKKISTKEAYSFFLTILDDSGYELLEDGQYTKIIVKPSKRTVEDN